MIIGCGRRDARRLQRNASGANPGEAVPREKCYAAISTYASLFRYCFRVQITMSVASRSIGSARSSRSRAISDKGSAIRTRVCLSAIVRDSPNPSKVRYTYRAPACRSSVGARELTMPMSCTPESIAYYDAAVGNKPGPGPHREDDLRTCVDCGLTRPLDEYVRIRACVAGWYGRCRICRNRRARERYHSSPEIRAAEIARSSRNQKRRRMSAANPNAWSPSPAGFVVGLLRTRRISGLTQKALALRAGIAPETLGRLERGERRAHGPTINALTYALGVPVSALRVAATWPTNDPRHVESGAL